VLRAICDGDIPKLEQCLRQGWQIDQVIDTDQKYTALTLACHLDKLEIVHFLDLHGANLSQGQGKFSNTPLMAASQKWNVRIIDYLLERGVDPTVKDKFGFTALKKAELRNLRTISLMIKSYEDKLAVKGKQKFVPMSAVTNEYWVRQIKLLNAKLAKQDKKFVPLEATEF
jgi:ankyrin repeat protein